MIVLVFSGFYWQDSIVPFFFAYAFSLFSSGSFVESTQRFSNFRRMARREYNCLPFSHCANYF